MKLYDFQREGAEYLATNWRAYLADEMGLGKTVQAAAAARMIRERHARPLEVCVIAPASSLENWAREWETWGPSDGLLNPVSYASTDLAAGRLRRPWDIVIMDEAHYAKNPRAKRTLNALNVARRGTYTWLLSGTPAPNHPGEIWPAVRALWPMIPDQLGITSYMQWFSYFNKWTQTRYGPRPYAMKNADMLRSILRKIMLRRKLADVEVDMPPLRVDVSLLPKDSSFATALAAQHPNGPALIRSLEAEADDENASLSRLRRLLGEYKAPKIGGIIADELWDRQYDKVVVLAYHHAVLDSLRQSLDGLGVVGFDGRTPAGKRQAEVDAFTNDPSKRVFLAQQTAAGIAINLQAATEVVLVEPAWTPDDNRQAIKRIHRIGQTHPCRARVFGVSGTLDAALMGVVALKTRMQKEAGL